MTFTQKRNWNMLNNAHSIRHFRLLWSIRETRTATLIWGQQTGSMKSITTQVLHIHIVSVCPEQRKRLHTIWAANISVKKVWSSIIRICTTDIIWEVMSAIRLPIGWISQIILPWRIIRIQHPHLWITAGFINEFIMLMPWKFPKIPMGAGQKPEPNILPEPSKVAIAIILNYWHKLKSLSICNLSKTYGR